MAAAVGKITLDVKEYMSLLEQVKKKTESSSNEMAQSVGKASRQIKSAGAVLGTLGSSIGSQFGALGNIISGLTAGPIALFTTAIGAAIAIGVQLWDKLTMSAEEYAAEMERVARESEKAHQNMVKQMDEDSGYMDRLAELAKKENLSNEAKSEAAALIQMLTSRYGDLGISIDAVTGQIVGMDAAQEKFLKKQREMKSASLQRQISTSENAVNSKLSGAVSEAGGIGEKLFNMFGDSLHDVAEVRRQIMGAFQNMSLQEKLDFARNAQDDSKTTSGMEAWQKVIDELVKQMDLRDQKKMVDDTSYETEAKAAAAARKKTQEAEAKAAEEQKRNDEARRFHEQQASDDKALEDLRRRGRNAESDYEFAHAATPEEKVENREARIREEEAQIAQLEEAKKAVDVFTDGVEGAQKKLHEYDMAIEAARQRIAGFQRQIDEAKNTPAKIEEPESARRQTQKVMAEAVKTDSLTARGGMLGAGVRSEDTQRTEQVKKVASSTEMIKRLLEKINEQMKIE